MVWNFPVTGHMVLTFLFLFFYFFLLCSKLSTVFLFRVCVCVRACVCVFLIHVYKTYLYTSVPDHHRLCARSVCTIGVWDKIAKKQRVNGA